MSKNISLADYLDANLNLLSIGLNPSIPSVEAGFYFANPRNRFWKALNQSSLIRDYLKPSADAMEILFQKYKIGFTDIVKRATRNGSELRAQDYKQGAFVLQSKILEYKPRLVWFHGKVAYRNYLKYTANPHLDISWGLQKIGIADIPVYLTPNPSPANAVFSLNDLVVAYNQLADYFDFRF